MTQPPDVTGLLVAWSHGDAEDDDRLIEAVDAELRALARGCLRRERPDHSLAPTALVHEAYLRLVDQRRVPWHSRAHFFAIAAHVRRRLIATVLGVAPITVKRDWALARAWLLGELRGDA